MSHNQNSSSQPTQDGDLQTGPAGSIPTATPPARTLSLAGNIVAFCITGSIALASASPIEAAKKFLETQEKSSDPVVRSVNTISGAFRHIYAREGAKGLFRGLGPRLAKTLPVFAALGYISHQVQTSAASKSRS